MRIGIIGSGALGLYYGGMLQRSGHDTHFLLRRDYQAIKKHGLKVYSPNGDFHLTQVSGYLNPADIGTVDLVVVGLKTISNHQLLSLVEPLLDNNTAILTLQNGLGNEELLAGAFGAERILGGIAFLCSNRGEPGEVHHLGEGKIRLGEYSSDSSNRSLELTQIFCQAGIPCQAVNDLKRARWEKLVWNIPFNGLSALLNKDVTEILVHPANKKLVKDLMAEAIAGANAQTLQEPIDPEKFSTELIEFTEKMDHYKPSMMIDRAARQPLELEAIYAIPLHQAKQAGVDMPRIEMLYSLLDIDEP